MPILHIENTVRDFDSWKTAFDKYEQFRAAQGVRAYRMTRSIADPTKVNVDLGFDTVDDARAFVGHLEKIWASPQSQREMLLHSTPEVYEVVVDRSLAQR